MKRVLSCLGMTEEEYCEHQFAEYCDFVEQLTVGWSRVREELLYSPVFRGFWNNEWARRNREDFLSFALECEDMKYNREEYAFLHSHERLLSDGEFMGRYYSILKII